MPKMMFVNPVRACMLATWLVGAIAWPRESLAANIIRVDLRSPVDGPGDRRDWSNAFHHLQDALAAAQPGDWVLVAEGRHAPDQGATQEAGDRSASFTIKVDGLRLFGGYAGFSSPHPDVQDPLKHPTILTGDLRSDDDVSKLRTLADNSRHVVRCEAVSSRTHIDGFTITGGYVGDTDIPRGGGMLNIGASPRISRVHFINNWATAGAGMYNLDSSSPLIIQCTFERNVSTFSNGGGMFNIDQSSPLILNCKFLGNRAKHVGGGVSIRGMRADQTIHIVNSVFVGNNAGERGGGIRAGHSTRLNLVNCTFVANSAGPATIREFPIGGGGLALGGDSPDANVHEVFASNCIFRRNFIVSGAPGTTIYGPQIGLNGGFASTLHLAFCNVQDMDTTGDNRIYVQEGFTLARGNGNIDVDPVFRREPNAGPDKTWGTLDDDYGDLRLSTDSPCIDQGDLSVLVPDEFDINVDGLLCEQPVPDLAMHDRIQNGCVDLGSYETQRDLVCALDRASAAGGTPDGWIDHHELLAWMLDQGRTRQVDVAPQPCGDGIVDVADLARLLRHWGPCDAGHPRR